MHKKLTWTHQHHDFKMRYGHPLPFGATLVPNGINFSIFSANATACTLVLYDKGAAEPKAEIPYPAEFRIGDIYTMTIFDLDPAEIEYGFRFEGPYDPRKGQRFDSSNILLDPYAQEVAGAEEYGRRSNAYDTFPHRGVVPLQDFDWKHDRHLMLDENEMIIYEMHLRGFTRHPSSGVQHPGTFEGMMEKIDYLRELGVNCVELMPIFEFNEMENTRTNPMTGEPLCNYWGYSTLGFFSPKNAYAAHNGYGAPGNELRRLVASLHEANIEILLDVVYNHTAEQGEGGPTISFRGIDNRTYYILDKEGNYPNYSGCGNTLNCNHPAVRNFVIDSLRYWAAEYHIDGFRFDLASVLGRDSSGIPLKNPPLLEDLAHDPVLASCDLIAEAWDAGGLYQVGTFPAYGRWMEWNGKFRDAVRKFLKGDPGLAGEMVQRILGSPDLYASAGRKPTASVNFITAHDGFTLRDLYSYNEKHNLENGENNADGSNDNYSWNCGEEGETDDPEINALRLRMQKNALTFLFVSQGVPMLVMGDECGRTQRGNNNAYCHDEEWNWFDWSLTEKNRDLFRFTKRLIAFRKANPALRQSEFLTGRDTVGSGYPDISWHGVRPWRPDWTQQSHTIAFMLCGRHGRAAGGPSHFIYCVFNAYWKPLRFNLPVLPRGMQWWRVVDTAEEAPRDIAEEGKEYPLDMPRHLDVTERSAVVLLGK